MIPEITKILYATDRSKNASYAFLYAVDMAIKHNAKIVILHCVQLFPYKPALYEKQLREAEEREQENVRKDLEEEIMAFCKKMDAYTGSPCSEHVSKILVPAGHPVEEILAAADAEGCDAIVLGSHGKGLLQQTFLGGTAAKVAERATKPVFIIPLPKDKKEHKFVLDNKKVLAVDDEPDVLAVLKEEIAAKCSECAIDTATSYDQAVKLIGSEKYDLIILDIMGVRGFDLLETAVKHDLKAVMLTAHSLNAESLKRAYEMGARAYLPKDKLGEIVPFLEDALKYDFAPGWKRLLGALGDVFISLLGRDWEKWAESANIKPPRDWSE